MDGRTCIQGTYDAMRMAVQLSETDQLGLRDLLEVEQVQQMLDALANVLPGRLVLEDAAGIAVTTPSVPARGWRSAGLQAVSQPAGLRVRQVGSAVAARGGEAGDGMGHGREQVIAISEPGQAVTLGRLRVVPMGPQRMDALRLARLLAAGLGRIASHERESRRRLAELTAVYNTSMMLAEARDLPNLLARTVRLVAQVMGVKGTAIRLIDEERDELRLAATWGLGEAYIERGPLRLSRAGIDHVALERGHEQVLDMSSDPRIQFRELPAREGLVSMLSVAMRYKGQAIGVLRAYTDRPHRFSASEVELVRAVASQASAAIVNARLAEETAEAEALEKQVRLAADVQQRMIPAHPPVCRHIDFATVYVPCFELAGDLFDFIELGPGRWGLVVADVAGKGVPASLIMATVRAFLRASTDSLDEPAVLLGRLNRMLCRDTLPGEFVSLFYAVLDGPARTLTYTTAGHMPPMLLRGTSGAAGGAAGEAELMRLGTDDMVLGVLEEIEFRQASVSLEAGDRLLLFTDGLSEARDFNDQLFGEERVIEALAREAEDAEGMIQNVLWDMRRFVGLQRRSDDVTMIGIVVRE